MMLPEEYRILKYLLSCGGKCSAKYISTLSDEERSAWDVMRRRSINWVALTDGKPDGFGGFTDYQSAIITEEGKRAMRIERQRRKNILLTRVFEGVTAAAAITSIIRSFFAN